MNDDTAVWPPKSTVPESTWTIDDVQPGDLVFSSKEDGADLIQRVNQLTGHRWRHVASVIERGGQLHVVEIDKNSFGFRPLTAFVDAFDQCGAARLNLDPGCITQANAWMAAKIETDHIYAWDDLFLAGILALTTKGFFVTHREAARTILHGALEAAKEGQRVGAADSYTCSGFIQLAYEEADGKCSIAHDRWRRTGSWPPRLDSLDGLLAADLDPGERARLDDLYSESSLLELFDLVGAVDRSQAWRPSPGQVWELIRVLGHGIANFRGEAPDRLVTDGRWVTPTDLWESSSISSRGTLVKPTE